MVFVFSREGPVEEFGAAEELAEAPEAIEMPVVLWTWQDAQVPRIWSEQLRTYAEELRILEEQEQREELAVRTLTVKHLAYAQASLPWISSA